ncbi:hypothetical protein BH20GEM1_BH20GEM1_04280 [soil metagenome]
MAAPPGAPRVRPRRWLALAVLVGFVFAGRDAAIAQAPSAPERIEVLVDASAEMRVRIGDVERIVVAREFLTALHAGLRAGESSAPSLRLFGATSPASRRDCTDTRLAVEAGAAPARWAAAVAAIEPLGISPLAHALERAAGDSASTYLLVAAGGEDCRVDPCEVWKEVVGGGPNRRSRLHVVALAPAPDDLEALRCLSRAGSGSLTVIDTPGEAASAGRRVALILRNEGLVEVRATLGRGGARIALPVRVERPVGGEVVVAFAARGPRPVPAGVYRVVVESAPPLAFERVMVLPGETATLEASGLGRLRVELLDDRGGHVRAPVSIRSGDGRRELRYGVTGEDAVMRAGTYDISVDLGDSVVVRGDVVVSAGRTNRTAFGGGGTLLVLSPEFESPPPTLVLASRSGVVDTLRVGVAHPLPGGAYRLIVETLPVYVTENVAVGGESQTVVTLPETGVLGVALGGVDGEVSGIRVEVQEVLTGETYGTIRSGERRLVMPGRYDLRARTVPPATFPGIQVTAGQERIVRRDGLSGIAVAAPPGDAGPFRLVVLKPAGEALGEATGPEPALNAWPGDYLVRVWRGRNLAWEGRVAVASDKTARIDLASP